MATKAQNNGDARAIIEAHVRKTWADTSFTERWRNLPEIPSQAEIMPAPQDSSEDESTGDSEYHADKPYGSRIPINIVNGPWRSKSTYIAAHYQILREDAIGSLRESVALVRDNPNMDDDQTTCIYDHVYFKGIQASALGVAFRVEFSYERAGKKIRWEQSKRLQQGTLVALSPQRDRFRNICKMATIAARPIKGGLDQNPPSVDLFWGDEKEADFQPGEPFMMIESRTGYFEASRHMLVALQKLMTEKFPLSRHIVGVTRDVDAPRYIKANPFVAMNSLRYTTVSKKCKELSGTSLEDDDSLDNINICEKFPDIANTGLDGSQIEALQRMLNKRLAIIQGPPGTGKTFVSVAALMVMLENWIEGDAPIVVAAQTNHALDQLLNYIRPYMPDFVRLGGRGDQANTEIQERTLFMLRKKQNLPGGRRGISSAFAQLKRCTQELQFDLAPILNEDPILDQKMLDRGVLTQAQYDSLQDDSWISASSSAGLAAPTRLYSWLGDENIVAIDQCPAINMGFEEEEIDLEFEQLQELELEAGEGGPNDNDLEALGGTWIPFNQRMVTGRHASGWSNHKLKKYLQKMQNLWDIPSKYRGVVFRHLWKEMYLNIRQTFLTHLGEYSRAIQSLKIEKDVANVTLVKQLGIKLIGCTTTGLSKYRGFLAGLKPRAMLIEEAAEALEGSITAALFESLEHLILVGDHKQLQAHGNIQILQQEPYNLNISLFERLMNSLEHTMLNKQRRMIPEIRKLLCTEKAPFYRDLEDHEDVKDRKVNRPPVEGMGGINSYFFGHNWPENRDSDASRSNIDEAEMITGLFNYLVYNGTNPSKVTILTFYNGQRKLILRMLKKHPDLSWHTYFNVFTVDSYQGEENDIIFLSLVRSNDYLGIGFLENQNRLVVALSRARRGLYIFGNPITLTAKDQGKLLFDPIIETMGLQGHFNLINKDGSPAQGFPITCTNHGVSSQIFEASEWKDNNGGCDRLCGGELPCGHACYAKCHPFGHDVIRCKEPCPSILECGHCCHEACGEPCLCYDCGIQVQDLSHISPARDIAWQVPLESSFVSTTNSALGTSPSKDSQKSIQKIQKSWNNWDAQKADRELDIERQKLATMPRLDNMVFKETYRPAVMQNGVRVVAREERRTIDRANMGAMISTPIHISPVKTLSKEVSLIDLDGQENQKSIRSVIATPHPTSRKTEHVEEDLITLD